MLRLIRYIYPRVHNAVYYTVRPIFIFILILIFLAWYKYLHCSQHLRNYHFVINNILLP